MSVKFRSIMIIGLVAVLVVVLVGAGSRATAQSGGDEPEASRSHSGSVITFDPVPGGPNYVSINGATFTPQSSETRWALFNLELYNPSETDESLFTAPVSLPQGATVTKLVGYYFDLCDQSIRILLSRKPLNETVDEMADAESYSNPGYTVVSDDSISFARVDNQIYSYVAIAIIPPGCIAALTLVSVRVDYSYPIYEPVILR